MEFEPAERDPVAIRRTVLILIAIILGGVFVTNAYRKMLMRQHNDLRPAYKQGLRKNLQLVRHDRKTVSLSDLSGQVWLCAAFSAKQPDAGKLSREAMVELAQKFSKKSDVRFVLMTVDPEEERPDVLADFAKENEIELPQWWVVAADGDKLRKYMKNEMRYGVFPHKKDEGKWDFDTSIVVVDRNRHIRGHFDFDQAVKQGEEWKKKKGEEVDARGQLVDKLEGTINYLLENDQ